jgi:hypothetical protein
MTPSVPELFFRNYSVPEYRGFKKKSAYMLSRDKIGGITYYAIKVVV